MSGDGYRDRYEAQSMRYQRTWTALRQIRDLLGWCAHHDEELSVARLRGLVEAIDAATQGLDPFDLREEARLVEMMWAPWLPVEVGPENIQLTNDTANENDIASDPPSKPE